MKVLRLLLMVMIGSPAFASEPFTADSGQLCIAAIQQSVKALPLTISLNELHRIPILPSEPMVVTFSRAQKYNVVIHQGGRKVHSFKLSAANNPTGNVCLRSANGAWSLSPQPRGMSNCKCQLAPNNSFKPKPLRGSA